MNIDFLTPDDKVFIDTNILVFATIKTHDLYLRAQDILTNMSNVCELWISYQIIREYLCVMTRPATYKNRNTVDIRKLVPDIIANINEFIAYFNHKIILKLCKCIVIN